MLNRMNTLFKIKDLAVAKRLSTYEMNSTRRVQISDEALCLSIIANALIKLINLIPMEC